MTVQNELLYDFVLESELAGKELSLLYRTAGGKLLPSPITGEKFYRDWYKELNEEGFAEHLLQNAFNALYHNELYCCDWDMFWTAHKDAVKHSLLCAVSGGPIYVSDRIGSTNPEVLKPLVYPDGEILSMDRSAKPTEDCVFTDPLSGKVLKLQNTASYGD